MSEDNAGGREAGRRDAASSHRRSLPPGGDEEHTDAALVEAHLSGDPAAFGQLFERHRGRLWAVAVRTTGNSEDAADALQDAMISAFRRAETFRGDSAVTTWLHRIVVNACLDRLRRSKVRAADPLPVDLEERALRRTVMVASDSDPEMHVLVAERRRRVLAALEQLSPDQRAALVLVDMEAYPVAEAGRILDVPAGTIKSRCARGRTRLAVLLADLDTQAGNQPDNPAGNPATPFEATATTAGPTAGPTAGTDTVTCTVSGQEPARDGTPHGPRASHPRDTLAGPLRRAGPGPDPETETGPDPRAASEADPEAIEHRRSLQKPDRGGAR